MTTPSSWMTTPLNVLACGCALFPLTDHTPKVPCLRSRPLPDWSHPTFPCPWPCPLPTDHTHTFLACDCIHFLTNHTLQGIYNSPTFIHKHGYSDLHFTWIYVHTPFKTDWFPWQHAMRLTSPSSAAVFPRLASSRYFSATSRRASLGHSLNQSMVVQLTKAGYWRMRFLSEHNNWLT